MAAAWLPVIKPVRNGISTASSSSGNPFAERVAANSWTALDAIRKSLKMMIEMMDTDIFQFMPCRKKVSLFFSISGFGFWG